MATTTIKLLMKEYQIYLEDLKGNDHTTCLYSLEPSKDSFFKWNLTLFGPEDSHYEGGIFNGCIKFPSNYPNDPPDAKCPFCGSSDAICSWIDSVPRSWARQACQKRNFINSFDQS